LPLPCDDLLAAIAGLDIGDEDEAVGQLPPPGSRQTKAFLVGLDRQPHHLVGDFEEIRLEFAHQHDRPFDEAGDLIQQALVLDQFDALREGEVARVGGDDVLAAFGVEHHAWRLSLPGVVVEAAHGDRVRRVEAVAERDVAGLDPSTSKSMTSVSSVSGPKVHRIDCSGRTQRSEPGSREALPQRIDLGQGRTG
jgi:hypothetical protein